MTTSSRWTILGSLSLVAALAVGAMGCQQDGSAGPSADESTEAAAQPVTGATAAAPTEAVKGGRDHRGGFRRHGPPGPDGLLFAAMHELTLSDAQKTAIQGAIDSLKPSDSERPAHDASPFKTLAAGVRSGKVDTAVLPARDATHEARFAAHRAKLAAALTTLHDTLTAEQRQTLVAAVQAKMDEHAARMVAPDAGDATGDRPAHGGRGGKHGRGGERAGHGPLGMLRDLDLSDAQKQNITKALDAQRESSRPADGDREVHRARFEAMRTEMKTRLASFAADRFDASAFTAAPASLKDAPKHPGDHLAADLAVIVPLLTDAQRATLADRLETPPAPPAGHAER